MAKVKEHKRLRLFWLLPIVCGCFALFGIGLSTVSAHPQAEVGTNTVVKRSAVLSAASIGAGAGDPPKRMRFAKSPHRQGQPWLTSWMVRMGILLIATGAVPIAGVLAVPLTPRKPGQPLRVLIIGRISTVHQQVQSIEASYVYVEQHLARIYQGPLVITHLGERASGMLVDRATIRQAEDMIAAGEVDLVIAEDLSRIFRNPRHQAAFVQDCVDARVRVICIADNLDTTDDNWELMLGAAGLRHGLVVSDTRRRVRRSATYSFHSGGLVQKVRYGYRKLSKEEAASGIYGPPGLRIAKDAACTPIIRQMREMVIAGTSYTIIANWLNEQGIRPGPYAKNGKWTAKLVADFLRDPILHGERTFRDVMYERIHGTGKLRRHRNGNPERHVHAELAHLSLEEHAELLSVMEGRAVPRRHAAGEDHPRYRVSRANAIFPAQHAICNACKEPMYTHEDGQLKCRNAYAHSPDPCWNHVQVDAERIRAEVIRWLWEQLRSRPECSTAFLGSCWEEVERRTTAPGKLIEEADKEIKRLQQQAERLAVAIGEGGEIPVLLKRLHDLQAAIAAAESRVDTLKTQAVHESLPIDRAAFENDPVPALLELGRASYEFADLVKTVVTELAVVPVQDLLHGQVRPRIKVTVEFAETVADGAGATVSKQTAVFDVFDKPQHIEHIGRFRELKRQNPKATHAAIAEALGISKDAVKRLVQYSKLMDALGLTDPYVELTSKPVRASRWRRLNGDDADSENRS